VKPEPVVAAAKPVLAPAPEPIVKAPEPIVAVEKPTPPPKREPVPEPMKPEPVVAVAKPVPAPAPVVEKAEPAKESDHLESLLATIDSMGEEAEPEAPAQDENFASMLASLGSHGTEPQEQVSEPVPAQDDLAAYVQQLEVESAVMNVTTPEIVEQIEVIETPVSDADVPVRYVTSSKSAKIIEELLMKGKPKGSGSLGSFLDGIVEDINDK
jgi:hypothetical protein